MLPREQAVKTASVAAALCLRRQHFNHHHEVLAYRPLSRQPKEKGRSPSICRSSLPVAISLGSMKNKTLKDDRVSGQL